MDKWLPGFANGTSPSSPCTCANGLGDKHGCDEGLRASTGGQACLWFSQGCSIGCDTCEGFDWGQQHAHGRAHCKSPIEPTLRHEAWTMNVAATPGSANDSYRYNPWRAPGTAPVMDPCGQAGGRYNWQPAGGDAVFANTSLASFGDFGSTLPRFPSARWFAGSHVEVAWAIRFNHGGGYQVTASLPCASGAVCAVLTCPLPRQYRLCPADEEPSEACFQRLPLPFDRTKQALVWNNGTRWPMGANAIFVDEGTVPAGSTCARLGPRPCHPHIAHRRGALLLSWARNPIPRVNDNNQGQQDAAACPGPNGASGLGCVQFPPPVRRRHACPTLRTASSARGCRAAVPRRLHGRGGLHARPPAVEHRRLGAGRVLGRLDARHDP